MKFTNDLIALTISKSINMPILLLEMIVIARLLGPEGLGQWTLLVAAATLLHTVFVNWTHSITIRFGCEEWTQTNSFKNTLNTRLPIIYCAIAIVLTLIIFEPFQWLEKFYLIHSNSKSLTFFMFLTLWVTFETLSSLQAKSSFVKQAILMPSINLFSILLLLCVAIFLHVNNFIVLFSCITLFKCIAWTSVWMYELYNADFKFKLIPKSNLKKVILYAWPILPSLTLGYISDWGDHLLLNWYGTYEDVGIWGASYQIMLGVISINSILVSVLLPWLITKNQLSNEAPQYYVKDIAPMILSFWLMLIILIITVLPFLFIFLMGSKFQSAESIVLIISFAIISTAFSSVYGILFNLQNRLSRSLLYLVIMAVTNITLSFWLIPTLGIKGAAIGTVCSYLIAHILSVIDQHLFLDLPLHKISALFMVGMIFAALQFMAGTDILMRISVCLFSLLLLITTIRKTRSVQTEFINKIFKESYNPLRSLLNKMLVVKACP